MTCPRTKFSVGGKGALAEKLWFFASYPIPESSELRARDETEFQLQPPPRPGKAAGSRGGAGEQSS